MESVVVSVNPIIISGDFNIHIDVPDDPGTVKFLSILECMGLKNHVLIQPMSQVMFWIYLLLGKIAISHLDCQLQSITYH